MSDLFDKLGRVWGDRGPTLGIAEFLLLLALSGTAAFVLALLYTRFFVRHRRAATFIAPFRCWPSPSPAIFVCIRLLPLSLGLLGALSIVRFRTPIKEPEEIGFLMVVIATSLATATGLLGFFSPPCFSRPWSPWSFKRGTGAIFRRRSESGLVIATFQEDDYRARGAAVLDELARSGRSGGLESLTTQDGRVTVTWRFHGLPGSKAAALEQALQDRSTLETLAIVYAADAALP